MIRIMGMGRARFTGDNHGHGARTLQPDARTVGGAVGGARKKSRAKPCIYGGMNPSNPNLRQIAEAIVVSEVQPGVPADVYISSCLDIFKKIQAQMASLMGGLGFNAVISRALLLAQYDSAWLQFLKVKPDGSLEYAGDAESKWENTSVKAGAVALLSESSVRAGAVALLSELLGLLAAFIGENLTLHLLRELCPAYHRE